MWIIVDSFAESVGGSVAACVGQLPEPETPRILLKTRPFYTRAVLRTVNVACLLASRTTSRAPVETFMFRMPLAATRIGHRALALIAGTSIAGLGSAACQTAQQPQQDAVAPASMPRIGTMDERLQWYNIEMLEVSGGEVLGAVRSRSRRNPQTTGARHVASKRRIQLIHERDPQPNDVGESAESSGQSNGTRRSPAADPVGARPKWDAARRYVRQDEAARVLIVFPSPAERDSFRRWIQNLARNGDVTFLSNFESSGFEKRRQSAIARFLSSWLGLLGI
jgi:hypothetical protein